MKVLVTVLNNGKDIEEDISYLKYQLGGRQGGDGCNDNLPKIEVMSFRVQSSKPLIVLVECRECDIHRYIGDFIDISYIILEESKEKLYVWHGRDISRVRQGNIMIIAKNLREAQEKGLRRFNKMSKENKIRYGWMVEVLKGSCDEIKSSGVFAMENY